MQGNHFSLFLPSELENATLKCMEEETSGGILHLVKSKLNYIALWGHKIHIYKENSKYRT